MEPSWKGVLRGLGNDLVSRQVNLIVASEGMSAEPMPEPEVAMAQVATWYIEYLGLPHGTINTTSPDLEKAFGAILTAVQNLPNTTMDSVHYRVKGHAEQLRKIVVDGRFLANDLAAIRKAWELGVDHIMLQTTIGLDGDVVTRIDERYASADFEPLFQVHEHSVMTSTRTWKDVVAAAIDLLRDLFPSTT
jgi:hypothetical protein